MAHIPCSINKENTVMNHSKLGYPIYIYIDPYIYPIFKETLFSLEITIFFFGHLTRHGYHGFFAPFPRPPRSQLQNSLGGPLFAQLLGHTEDVARLRKVTHDRDIGDSTLVQCPYFGGMDMILIKFNKSSYIIYHNI